MCGICGYISKYKVSDTVLTDMNDTMYHRGPNDHGIYNVSMEQEQFSIGLAQRRLSILDLSSLGHQPMFSEDKSIGIVYNGEIYNYIQIRESLMAKGYLFKSDCDTEVIIYAYQEYGMGCINLFEGMFAFAIYDMKANKVILARDRIGKKPLYYYHKGDTFIFGSELKPIMKHPAFIKELNHEAIAKFMCYQYINEPDTIWKDTYKLPQGSFLIWEHGEITIERYWDIPKVYREKTNKIITDYGQAKEEFLSLLKTAVSNRMIADVPLGTFLSGGVDSVLVTSIAQSLTKDKVKTFTIGFDDKERNEAEYAKEIADYLGTEHTEMYTTEENMLSMIDDLCTYYDEPFADPSQLPMMLVCKMAREKITVALSGDGGDELFCGYSMYDFVRLSQQLDGIANAGYYAAKVPVIKQIYNYLPEEAKALLNNRNIDTKVQLFNDLPEQFIKRMLVQESPELKYSNEKQISILTNNWQERRMLLDMMTYLPEDVLAKTDRASMKYSLEVRCPLLDYHIIEFSYRLPHQFKYQKGIKKYLLKDTLYDFVPKEMMDRPKNGFGVPLGKWLRTYLKNNIVYYMDQDKIVKQGIFQYDVLRELVNRVDRSDKKPYPKLLWSFYVFQMWYEKYIGW